MTEPLEEPPLLQVLNPPWLISVAAECLAGALLAGAPALSLRPYLFALASALIFAAGSLFARYFDRAAELRDRLRPGFDPPRPPEELWRAGLALLVVGALLPGVVPGGTGRAAALAGIGVALAVVLYAAVTRGVWGAGFLTLGAARGLNLLLGMSAEPLGIERYALAALPVAVYAAGWAVLRARAEPGAPPTTQFIALAHLAGGVGLLLFLTAARVDFPAEALPFALAVLPLAFPRLVRATLDPRRPALAAAVQHGLLGLTLVDAALAAGWGHLGPGLLVALCGAVLYQALLKWPLPLGR